MSQNDVTSKPASVPLQNGRTSAVETQTDPVKQGNDNEDDEDIDQARNLLKGFDSDNEDPAEDEGLDKGKAISGLPHYKKTQKKLRQAAQKGNNDGPGVVYVGRIPHGFYETEMRQYFSQFGTITKLRLSRNRKTGRSKHFAFLEFESTEVAKIVAEAMDNYLMFGHILKCKFVERDAVHPETFKGANKRFHVAPYNKMEKRALDAPKTESHWTMKNEREQARRDKKAEQMKEMGYEYQAPELKHPSEVLEAGALKRNGAREDDAAQAEAVEGRNAVAVEGKKSESATTPSQQPTAPEAGPDAGEGLAAPNAGEGEQAKKQKRKKKGKRATAEKSESEQPAVAQPKKNKRAKESLPE